jgi:aspartate/glutamate racemase
MCNLRSRHFARESNNGQFPYPNWADAHEFALNFCKRDGLDAILLAGTDLPLIFNEANVQFPFIDCAALHIEAILQKVLPKL